MSVLDPIPRSYRRQLVACDLAGQTIFGPLNFKIYAVEDLEVMRQAVGEDGYTALAAGFTVTIPVTVPPSPGYPTVTFAAGQGDGDLFKFVGKRVHERQTDVTLGGVIRSAQLELQLDMLTTVAQELRRDIDALEQGESVDDATLRAEQARDQAVAAQAAAEAARDIAVASTTGYREVTAAGAVLVDPTDGIVGVNKLIGEATNVTLGLAAARVGRPISVADIKGDCDVNPITPVLSGGELINGLAGSAYVLSTPHGSFTLYPRAGGWYTLK